MTTTKFVNMSTLEKITEMLHMPTDMRSKGAGYDIAKGYGIAAKAFLGKLLNIHKLQDRTDSGSHDQATDVRAH